MATSDSTHNTTVEIFYNHRESLHRFIRSRVSNADDAEDILQDVFLRLLEYPGEILSEKAKSLAFAIACNAVNDYLRHIYVKTAAHSAISTTQSELTNDTENEIIGRDMAALERRSLESMPTQRRLIYMLRIHEGKSTKEIADELNISPRTAENHFYIGIREMRARFAAAI